MTTQIICVVFLLQLLWDGDLLGQYLSFFVLENE